MTKLHLLHKIAVRLHVHEAQRCYLYIGSGGHNWCFSSNLSLSVGFFIQYEAMDATRSALQSTYYHVDYDLALHQLFSRPTSFIPCWTTQLRILYEVTSMGHMSIVRSAQQEC